MKESGSGHTSVLNDSKNTVANFTIIVLENNKQLSFN